MPEIFILDRITVRPGRLGEYQARLRDVYLPLARARGGVISGATIPAPSAAATILGWEA